MASVTLALSDNSKLIVTEQMTDPDIIIVRRWFSDGKFRCAHRTSRRQAMTSNHTGYADAVYFWTTNRFYGDIGLIPVRAHNLSCLDRSVTPCSMIATTLRMGDILVSLIHTPSYNCITTGQACLTLFGIVSVLVTNVSPENLQ